MHLSDLCLGYVGVDASDLVAWEVFARDAIGFDARREGESLILRMDERARRFIIRPSRSDGVAYLGWEAPDAEALGRLKDAMTGRGVACRDLDAAALAERRVGRAFAFEGPGGLPFEVFALPAESDAPLDLRGLSGFVAGDRGMGHIAVFVGDLAAARAGFEELMGARLTDEVTGVRQGMAVRLAFLRFNPRHHSVALASAAGDRRAKATLHRVMVEAATIEDVGAACVRCKAHGYSLPMDAGQHANDKVTSFYVTTPSGFALEVGWGPVTVDDEAGWTPTVYENQQSIWGHAPFNP